MTNRPLHDLGHIGASALHHIHRFNGDDKNAAAEFALAAVEGIDDLQYHIGRRRGDGLAAAVMEQEMDAGLRFKDTQRDAFGFGALRVLHDHGQKHFVRFHGVKL